jgi:hypothetical protein
MSTNRPDPEIIARGKTFDGATIHLHADGSLSFRMHFIGRSKLPTETMWRAWQDISLYTADEVPAFIKAVKKGKYK